MLIHNIVACLFIAAVSSAFQLQLPTSVNGGASAQISWSRVPVIEPIKFTFRLTQNGKPVSQVVSVTANFFQSSGQEKFTFPDAGGNYVLEAVKSGSERVIGRQSVVVQQRLPQPPTPPTQAPNQSFITRTQSTGGGASPPGPTTAEPTRSEAQPSQTSNSVADPSSHTTLTQPGSDLIPQTSTLGSATANNSHGELQHNTGGAKELTTTVKITGISTDSVGKTTQIVMTVTSVSPHSPESTGEAAVKGATSKDRTAIIIGAVLGTILAIILLILLIICCRRRLREGRTARFRQDLMVRRRWLTGAEKAVLESPTSDVISEQSTGIISLSSESTQSLHFTDSSPSHSYYYKSNSHRGRDSIPFSEATAATTTTTPSTLRLPIEPKSSQHPMIVNTPATPPLPPPPARSGVMSFESSSTSSLSTFKAILPDHARDVGKRIADLEDQKRRLGSEMADSLLVRTIDEQIAILRDIR